jgi:hypothetical protein
MFSEDSWLFILFDNVYCDEHALREEIKAFNILGWVNSGLTKRFYEKGLIKTLPISELTNDVVDDFRKRLGIQDPSEVHQKFEHLTTDQLFALRYTMLDKSLPTSRFLIYDRYLSKARRPDKLFDRAQETVLQASSLPLTVSFSALPESGRRLFADLQKYEQKRLHALHRNLIDADTDWYPYLNLRRNDYQRFNSIISEKTQLHVDELFRVREKFDKLNGRALVDNYLGQFLKGEPEYTDDMTALRGEIGKTLERAMSWDGPDFVKSFIQIVTPLKFLTPLHHLEPMSQAVASLQKSVDTILTAVENARGRLGLLSGRKDHNDGPESEP